MLNTLILAIEALILVALLYFGFELVNGSNTSVYVTSFSILIPITEYCRRLLSRNNSEEKSMDAGAKVRHAEKLRLIIDEEVMKCRAEKLRKDTIIRHVSRLDEYPNINETSKGISSWFKVSLEKTYHSGIYVGLSYQKLAICPDGYKLADQGEDGVNAMLIGEIPFDVIETVNVEGDEYYPYPHIFCHFPTNNQPYQRLFYAEVIMQSHGHPHYEELATHDDVKLNTKLHKNQSNDKL